MSWKSTQNSNITMWATVEAMIRTGEEYRESIGDGSEVHVNGEIVRKAATNVTGHGGFVGTTAAAVINKRA